MAVCGDFNNLATSIWKLWRGATKVIDYINYYNDVSDDSSEVETEDILNKNENDKGFINDKEVEYDSFDCYGLTNPSRKLSNARNDAIFHTRYCRRRWLLGL